MKLTLIALYTYMWSTQIGGDKTEVLSNLLVLVTLDFVTIQTQKQLRVPLN